MTVSWTRFPARLNLKKSGGVVGEAQSRELPAMMGIKEVSIGDTAVPARGCKRGTAQHQLVDHELAVVLAERALDGPVAGIGGVGAAGPLPHDPEGCLLYTSPSPRD